MTSPDLALDRELAQRLPRTWPAFFGRHGRLTAVQRTVIPSILEGASTLISAPTAAGKTEAACAPVMERMLALPGWWRVLYVSPTRALVNDLYERLSSPMERLRVRLARRTGEHKHGVEEAQVLLTTPESFDSLLCNGRTDAGHLLAPVTCVILDEIHLLDGSARGEQLRWLLHRLKRLRHFANEQGWVRNSSLQVVALSATVPDLSVVRARYLPDGKVFAVHGSREIRQISVGEGTEQTETIVPRYLAGLSEPEKVLVFCQARRRVDLLTLTLRDSLVPLGYSVMAHHGSLAQAQRESVEADMKRLKKVVLVATSTLEIGVDIGDVDLVVLDTPPPDVPSLLQRIGRGNRRAKHTRVVTAAPTARDALLQEAMLEAARLGRLGTPMRGPQYAVAVQQLCSFIKQSPTGFRTRGVLEQLVAALVPDRSASDLLAHLHSGAVLASHGDRVVLGDAGLELTAGGRIHSTIESSGGVSVADYRTGETIATGVVHSGGRTIGVGGRAGTVRGGEDRIIFVGEGATQDVESAGWRYGGRKLVIGPGQPDALRQHLDIPSGQWPVIEVGGRSIAFHFGDVRLATLIRLAAEGRRAAEDLVVDPWSVVLPEGTDGLPDWMRTPDRPSIARAIDRDCQKIERALGRPSANVLLPTEWRRAEIEAWLGIEEGLGAMRDATLARQVQPELRMKLLLLLD